jgi:serine/threonine protein kinase/lipopolysaccharide biosynthesis regulator YciM
MLRRQWQKVKEVLSATKDTAPAGRTTFPDDRQFNEPPVEKSRTADRAGSETKTLPIDSDLPVTRSLKNDSADPLISQNIDSFKLLKKIGSGGMGDVYLAQDTELKRRVAIKFLPIELTKSRERVSRFRQEAQAISRLNHPNIITIHKIGQTAQTYYMVTEFIEGRTLRDLMDERTELSQILEILIQVTSALKASHEAGILHRDIKPENIMVRRDSIVKVLDFGLAKLVEQSPSESSTAAIYQTQTGMMVGTPNYMSPEQVEGGRIDARTDLFSLGSLLYECLTGKPPFEESSISKTFIRIINVDPPCPSTFNSQIIPELDEMTLRLLKKNPDERYQTAEEVNVELNRIKNRRRNSEQLTAATVKLQATVPNRKAHTSISALIGKSPAAAVLVPALILLAALVYLQAPFATFPVRTSAEAEQLLNSGTEALRDGTYYKAGVLLEEATKSDANSMLAQARLAEAWMELDYVGPAQRQLLKLHNFQPDRNSSLFSALTRSDDSLYVEAVTAMVVGDYPKAIGVYQTIAGRNSGRPQVYLDLGRAYEKNEEIDQALANYEKAISLNSQYGGAHLRKAILLSRGAEFQKSFEAFDRAEKIFDQSGNDEGVAEVKFQRGVSLNSQEKLDAAGRQFEEVLNTPRANKYQQIRAMLQISSVCCSGGKIDCAEEYASKAINLAKEERMENLATNGLIDLGNAYLTQRKYDAADKTFKQALEFARKDEGRRNEARVLLALASLRIEEAKPEEAEVFASQALPFFEKGGYQREVSQTRLALGRVSEMKGNYAAAVQEFEKVENSEKASVADRAYAHMLSGNVLILQEKYPAALERFEKSHELYRSLDNRFYLTYVLLYLGEILQQLGRFEEAKNKLSQANALIAEGGDSFAFLLVRLRTLNAQTALGERRLAAALSEAEQLDRTKDTPEAAEANKIIGLARSLSNSKSSEGVEKCRKALQYAEAAKDQLEINRTKLILAEAGLNTGNHEAALVNAVEAGDYFAASSRWESGWRAWTIAAVASAHNGDGEKARYFASKAAAALSSLRENWGEANFAVYRSKPGINDYIKRTEELSGS